MNHKMAVFILLLSLMMGNTGFQQNIEAILLNPRRSQEQSKVNDLKILLLIIACDHNVGYPNSVENDPVYPQLQKVWRSYMNIHPQVESYFIKANPGQVDEFVIQGDTIWCKGEETWIPGILNKTLISMEAMLPRLHEFHYVIRTNLSSFYIFTRLLKVLETLPRQKCYAGMECTNWGYYVNGAGIILSSDLVQLLIAHKNQLMNHPIIDDVAIGFFLAEHKIDIIKVHPRMDILSRTAWEANKTNISPDVFHIRARNNEGKRVPDEIIVQKALIRMFYGINVNHMDRESRSHLIDRGSCNTLYK